MAITYPITLSTTEPNNNIGLLKIRQADEETQTLVVEVLKHGTPVSYEGLQVFFCAKLGQTDGLGIIEQKLNPEEMTDPKNGKLEYTLRAEDWQVLGRQNAYFSFRKMTDDHTFVQQFSTRDFTYEVTKSIYSDGIKEVKKDGSTYVWTIEDLIRLFNEYIASGKTDWEEFVNQNKEIIESVDPGGILLSRIGIFQNFREWDYDIISKVKNEFQERGVNIRWFGAKGDGATDDTLAIQSALDFAKERKLIVRIPEGTFFSGALMVRASIVGEGIILLKSSSNYNDGIVIKENGISIEGITIKGSREQTGDSYNDYLGTVGIYARDLLDVRIENVKIENTFQMGMYFAECSRFKILNNQISNVRGNYGDGIFCTGCEKMIIDSNYCSDYTRIGIVLEGNETIKSKFNIISNNLCENGHDSSILTGGTEYNAGIWCENAYNNKILNNVINNQTHYGVVLVTMVAEADLDDSFDYVKNNSVKDCVTGFIFSANMMGPLRKKLQCALRAENNLVSGEYEIGIKLRGGAFKEAIIETFDFGSNESAGSFIEINTNGFRLSPAIFIRNCKKGTAQNKTDVNIIDNSQIMNLILENLAGKWSVITTDETTSNFSNIRIYNSELLLSGNICFAKATVEINNCKIELKENSVINECQTLLLKDSTFVPYSGWAAGKTLSLKSPRTVNIKIENCEFQSVGFYDMSSTANHVTRVQGSNWKEYPSSIGALLVNDCRLQVYETTFYTITDKKPIIQAGSNISVIELRNVFSRWSNPLNTGLTASVSVGCMAIPVYPI